MFRTLLKYLLYYLTGVLGIIFISIVPFIIQVGNIKSILIGLKDTIIPQFITPSKWVFIYKGKPEPIFQFLWEPFIYSMQILIGALVVGFLTALILVCVVQRSKMYLKNIVLNSLSAIETLPDVVFAYLFQLLVVYGYQKFGIDIIGIGALGIENKIFIAPILTVAILPFISMFKLVLILIIEEEEKPYIQLAKSKGLNWISIYVKHILRNIITKILYHSKVIIWATLSSLFVIGRLYNINDITYYLTLDFRPITIAGTLIMIFTPFFILYSIIELVYRKDENTNIVSNSVFSERNFLEYVKNMKLFNFSFINPMKSLIFLKNIFKLFKNLKFMLGFTFLFGIVVYSIIFTIMSNKPIKQVRFRTNENGGIEGGPPHPPGNPFLLGSDHYGFSILDQLIVGAKYTILGALIIVTLRIVIGFLFGVIYAFILNQKTQKIFEKITDSIHFIPLTVIAFILLRPVLINTNSEIWMYDLTGRIIIEITILTVLVIPLTSVLIGNEIKDAMNFEYVESSKILGGGRLWILKKHILPNIGQRLALLFGRQFNQVLTIFIHLGVFELFFGGTIQEKYNMPQRSFTHEWAGIIGANKDAILTGKHWLIIWALLAYIICSVTMQLFIRGIQELQEKKIEKKKSSAIHNKEDNEYVTSQISQEQSLVKKDDFKIISKY